jgi:hypothetical protein
MSRRGIGVGRVAQLVRALVSHTRGPGFESLRDHARPEVTKVLPSTNNR